MPDDKSTTPDTMDPSQDFFWPYINVMQALSRMFNLPPFLQAHKLRLPKRYEHNMLVLSSIALLGSGQPGAPFVTTAALEVYPQVPPKPDEDPFSAYSIEISA